jgi:hypothetical protein
MERFGCELFAVVVWYFNSHRSRIVGFMVFPECAKEDGRCGVSQVEMSCVISFAFIWLLGCLVACLLAASIVRSARCVEGSAPSTYRS